MFSMLSLLFFSRSCYYSFSLVLNLALMGFTQFISKNILMVSKSFSGDYMSFFLMMLTLWMFFLMLMKSVSLKMNLVLMMMNLMLIVSFLSSSLIKFFIFFELSILPALILIMGWGIQPERLSAGSYLMIYTFLGSMPLMLSFLALLKFENSLNFVVLSYFSNSVFFLVENSEYSWLGLFFMLGFLMKLPIFGLHLWLPKAHVEAPVVGSMMLAGVLLKLGSYGLMRLVKVFHLNYLNWGLFLKFWVCYSLMMVNLVCFRQNDLKSLVAYSSVSHMSLMVLSLSSGNNLGVIGVLLMSVAHGVCSSGLFANVKVFYFLSGSRKILFNRGFILMLPTLSFMFFCLCVSNCSAPPSLNLFAEIMIMMSANVYSLLKSFFLFISIFLVGLFSIYLYILVFHGKWSMLKNKIFVMKFKYLMMMFLHIFPCFVLFFLNKNFL